MSERLIPYLGPEQKQAFVAAVRTLLASRKGKPARWKHTGRNAKAVDCIGAPVFGYEAIEMGAYVRDLDRYSRDPDAHTLREHLRSHLGKPYKLSRAVAGDIALMRWYGGNGKPQWFNHVGVITNYVHGGLALLHSSAHDRKVVEHRIDEVWKRRIVEVYRT